jgi:streptomycin 6-kinase
VTGPLRIPRELREAADRGGWNEWLDALPATVRQLAERWSLTVGKPFEPGGHTAWVAPAQDASGQSLVLKVGRWHTEAEHEAEGLREWEGGGAVLVHATASLGNTVGLLLERCQPGNTLRERPEPDQDVVIAGLLRRLWREPPPGHRFRPLQVMCEEWADEFEQKAEAGGSELDPGLAREGIALFRSLPATADREVLLCTDLHAGNVLAAGREPWLVIDPKPYVGDPTYDVLQHLLNCERRLRTDPLGLIRRMADLVGLDAERLRLWLFARCVQESPNWRPSLAAVARRLAPT